MLVVGLTGGIGSGKSALAHELGRLGASVVDADQVARRCVLPGSPALDAVVARFGAQVLTPDGELDRTALAAIVFSDAPARRDLEAILHPCIRAGIDADVEAFAGAERPPAVLVIEHPLLVETDAHERVDRVVVVESPLEQRLRRLVEQRGMSLEDARARIDAQTDDAARRSVADHVVMNSGTLEDLRGSARALLVELTASEERPR